MPGEGLAASLSPEWIQATATGLLVLIGTGWVLLGVGALWRRTIWRSASEVLQETAAALEGQLRPRWNGFQVSGRGVRVRWSGGLRGPVTRVRSAAGRRREAGWIRPEL